MMKTYTKKLRSYDLGSDQTLRSGLGDFPIKRRFNGKFDLQTVALSSKTLYFQEIHSIKHM